MSSKVWSQQLAAQRSKLSKRQSNTKIDKQYQRKVNKMPHKKRPKEITLEVGEVFARQPLNYSFEIIKGTLPSYGRVILDIDIVSDDECVVYLGEVLSDTDTRKHSAQSTIVIKGDFRDTVTMEFEDLWLRSESHNTIKDTL